MTFSARGLSILHLSFNSSSLLNSGRNLQSVCVCVWLACVSGVRRYLAEPFLAMNSVALVEQRTTTVYSQLGLSGAISIENHYFIHLTYSGINIHFCVSS